MPGELQSWKEIASHLGVSVRTAQIWERERGLPIQRMPGGRGRVCAQTHALDEWKSSGPRPAESASSGRVEIIPAVESPPESGAAPRPENVGRKGRLWQAAAAAAFLVIVAGAAAVRWPAGKGAPARYEIQGNSLVVSDALGRELWRKPFESLRAESYREERFVWFGDLDGDGGTEVLFVPVTSLPDSGSRPLICYSARGRERWRFVPGRAVRTRKETFAPAFAIRAFAVAPLGPGKTMRVVATSTHYLYYPCQVVALAPDGRVVGEYWHSGQLNKLLVADVRRNGSGEILLAGVANGYRSATLVALDANRMAGASAEENKDYQLEGFGEGREAARVLFPRSCFNRLLEPFAVASALWQEPDGVALESQQRLWPPGGALYYHLRPDFSMESLDVSSAFEREHAQLLTARALDHTLGAREIAALKQIRYLKGGPPSAAGALAGSADPAPLDACDR